MTETETMLKAERKPEAEKWIDFTMKLSDTEKKLLDAFMKGYSMGKAEEKQTA